jgi:hypothetical protein
VRKIFFEGFRVVVGFAMRRISLCAVIVMAVLGCGEDHGPPFVCDALERDVEIEHGRRPNLDALSRPFRAGDSFPTLESTSIGPETAESLAYRAAVLGCVMGLEEIPGSIRTWAANTKGRVMTAPNPFAPDEPSDPWETFEVDGVTFVVTKSADDTEKRGGLSARREGGAARLDQLPDAVGFPIVQDVVERLIDAGVLASDSISIPASYAERPPLSPARETSTFSFVPRLQGARVMFMGGVSVSLAADGSVRSIATVDAHVDAHVDESELVTLRRGELEAALATREDVPEWNVVERDELVYWKEYIDGGVGHLLIHAPREGGQRLVRTLSLTSEDATVVEASTSGGWDTSDWW